MKLKVSNLDHTADAGFEIFSPHLEELFTSAAEAMYRVMECPEQGTTIGEKILTLEESSLEDLMVSFLNELNYYISVRFLFLYPVLELRINRPKKEYELKVKTGIRKLTQQNLDNLVEIKSVTYHNLDIKHEPDGYHTKLIFDL